MEMDARQLRLHCKTTCVVAVLFHISYTTSLDYSPLHC